MHLSGLPLRCLFLKTKHRFRKNLLDLKDGHLKNDLFESHELKMCALFKYWPKQKRSQSKYRDYVFLAYIFSLLNYPRHFEMKIKKKNKDFASFFLTRTLSPHRLFLRRNSILQRQRKRL